MSNKKVVKASEIKKDRVTKLTMSDGAEYSLVLNMNALVRLEEYYVTADDALRDVDAGKITAFRCLLWAMMCKHHPELTIEDVGELLDAHEMVNMVEAIQATVTNDMPEPEESDADLPN